VAKLQIVYVRWKWLLRKKFVHFVAMGLFHEWAGCCSIFSTHLNPALVATRNEPNSRQSDGQSHKITYRQIGTMRRHNIRLMLFSRSAEKLDPEIIMLGL